MFLGIEVHIPLKSVGEHRILFTSCIATPATPATPAGAPHLHVASFLHPKHRREAANTSFSRVREIFPPGKRRRLSSDQLL